jgi:hypothetical protein
VFGKTMAVNESPDTFDGWPAVERVWIAAVQDQGCTFHDEPGPQLRGQGNPWRR